MRVREFLLAAAGMAAVEAMSGASHAAEQQPMACLSNAESRDAMQVHRTVPLLRAVGQALQDGGDVVAIRLCHGSDTSLVFDIAVLRRDGRLVHVTVDAGTGAALPTRR